MLAKQLEYLGGAQLAGIVLGARVPVILTSRADSAETRLTSCAVACLLHYATHPVEIAYLFNSPKAGRAPIPSGTGALLAFHQTGNAYGSFNSDCR